MAEVTLVINDRSYDVACDDGQESHLQDLAAHINERIQDLAESVGQVGESRLLVMTSLLIADELYDAYREIHSLRSGEGEAVDSTAAGGIPAAAGREISAAIDSCASRLEALTARLAKS